jgi:hypothetical protein
LHCPIECGNRILPPNYAAAAAAAKSIAPHWNPKAKTDRHRMAVGC